MSRRDPHQTSQASSDHDSPLLTECTSVFIGRLPQVNSTKRHFVEIALAVAHREVLYSTLLIQLQTQCFGCFPDAICYNFWIEQKPGLADNELKPKW